jgi:hypothetical protein
MKFLSSEEARLIGVGIPKATRLYQMLEGWNKTWQKFPCLPMKWQKIREALKS